MIMTQERSSKQRIQRHNLYTLSQVIERYFRYSPSVFGLVKDRGWLFSWDISRLPMS
jgi:hypothetical protein